MEAPEDANEANQPDYTEDDCYGDCDCWYCGGEGWGIVGTNWDSHDPINGPYDGEIERCPIGKVPETFFFG